VKVILAVRKSRSVTEKNVADIIYDMFSP